MTAFAFILPLVLVFSNSGLIQAGEYCRKSPYIYCFDYCCGDYFSQSCCPSCSRSIYYHSECYVGPIVGGVIGFVILVLIGSTIVAICCGCICSRRTGIQRRGVIIRSQEQPYYGGTSYPYTGNQTAYQPGQPIPQSYQPTAAQPYPVIVDYAHQPPAYNPGFAQEPK